MKTLRFFVFIFFLTILVVSQVFAQQVPDYVVRVIYFLPFDRDADPDADTKLDTMLKNAQKFFAAQQEAHGFDQKTFQFESDTNGNLIVHHIIGDYDEVYYLRNSSQVWDEVDDRFDMSYETSRHIYLCFIDTLKYCFQRGGGESCAVGFGSGNSLNGRALAFYDGVMDTNAEYSVNSEYIAIHELGHAFGLMHDYRTSDANRIYAVGNTDRMLTSFAAADWLDGHRYFNVRKKPFNRNTQIDILPALLGEPWYYIRFRCKISDPNGLHHAILFSPNLDSIVAYKNLAGHTAITAEFTTHRWTGENAFSLRVMDANGNISTFNLPIEVSNLLPAPKAIDIPDANLAAALRKKLQFSKEDAITQLDMLQIRRFDAVDRQIKDITGLEYAINMEVSYLDRNRIRDVTALSRLPQIKTLSLRTNPIRDVSTLASASTLESLSIDWTQVTDSKNVAALTQLKVLSMGFNQVQDITALSALTNLESLQLYDNQINDITPLSRLTQLKSLDLFGNEVTDVSSLSSLKQLEYLDLRANQLSDIASLSSLKKLKSLELSRNQVTDITPLAALTQLENIDLSDNPIRDVSMLAELVNLKQVKLINTPIRSKKPLLELLRKKPDVKIYLKSIEETLPVTLSSFKATRTADGAVIHWITESEVDNAGFNILRSNTKTGEFQQINVKLIQGAGTTGERSTYTWTDTTAKPNTVYYYQIEDVSYAGVHQTLTTTRLRGLVSAKGKMTTQWADFKKE